MLSEILKLLKLVADIDPLQSEYGIVFTIALQLAKYDDYISQKSNKEREFPYFEILAPLLEKFFLHM
jgi:hypothetical protein